MWRSWNIQPISMNVQAGNLTPFWKQSLKIGKKRKLVQRALLKFKYSTIFYEWPSQKKIWPHFEKIRKMIKLKKNTQRVHKNTKPRIWHLFWKKLMGGYFIGGPMDPESRPAKTKKAKARSRVKSHGLGWRQASQGPCGGVCDKGVLVQLRVLTWKDKA